MVGRQRRLVCPVCDDEVTALVLTDIDGETEPDLLRKLVTGRHNTVTCPTCGHSGLVPEPVIIRYPSRGLVVGFMPVEVESNRKAHLSTKLRKQIEGSPGSRGRTVKICFGARQLERELPDALWSRKLPEFSHRFDCAGPPAHRRFALRRALKGRSGDPVLLTRLGIASYEDHDLPAAREALEQALEGEPGLVDALHCLASVSLDEGRHGDALRLYDRVVSITHDPLPRFLAGVAAYRAGQVPSALERLRQATRDAPDLLDAHVWQAIAHLALNDKRGAMDALRHAEEHGLRDPDLILSHPEFAALLSESGFKTLMALMKRSHRDDGAQPQRTVRKRRPTGHRPDDRPQQRRPRPARSRAR